MTGLVIKILLCLVFLMNIYHLFQISEDYFKYDVVTKVKLSLPKTLELPSISLCFELELSIKYHILSFDSWSKLIPNDEEYGTCTSNASQIREFISNPGLLQTFISKHHEDIFVSLKSGRFSTAEIFNLTLNWDELVEDVVLYEESNETYDGIKRSVPEKLNDYIRINESINFNWKCFTMTHTPKHRFLDYQLFASSKRQKGLIEYITLRKAVFGPLYEVKISFQKSDKLQSMEQAAILLPLSGIAKSHYVSFDTFEALLLEPPYSTNCMWYLNDVSQVECFDDCVKLMSVRRLAKIPVTSSLFKDDISEVLHGREMIGQSASAKIFSHIKSTCRLQCSRKECESRTMIPKVFSTYGKNGYDDLIGIAIMLPKTPTIHAIDRPAVTFVNFVTYFFSTFGFWLGVSVADVIHLAGRFWSQIKTKIEVRRSESSARMRLQVRVVRQHGLQ